MSNKIEKLESILLKYYKNTLHDGGSGRTLKLPEFELFARDYLKFAEEGLNNGSNLSLINCVSNLKRAMDCQIDTFFSMVNLYEYISKRNLKFEKKLSFIEEIGLFSSRSLSKLNTIRNKMEHLYEVPKIIEIELYFELVHALVKSLEIAISLLEWHSSLVFLIFEDIENQEGERGYITFDYNFEEISFRVNWKIDEEKDGFKVGIDNYKDFGYLFRIHLLMYQIKCIGSREYVESKLKYNLG